MQGLQTKAKNRKGFLLMESLLAFAIFGIAVTSILIAVHETAEVSNNISQEAKTQLQLKQILTEVLTIPLSEKEFERDEIIDLPEDTRARVQVTPADDIYANQDISNGPLKQLYTVKITLIWNEGNVEKTKTAETTHYYPLCQR